VNVNATVVVDVDDSLIGDQTIHLGRSAAMRRRIPCPGAQRDESTTTSKVAFRFRFTSRST
jgi:hypothetical protein